MTARDPFPYSTDPTGRRCRTLTCGACDQVGYLSDSRSSGLPHDTVVRKFTQQGWKVGRLARQHRCPACLKSPKPQETPMPKPAPAAAELPVRAEPPPVLTPPARRRIMEALEAAYDLKAQRYAGAGTDAQIAAELKVPRAWVEEVRDALFGPPGNERQAIRDRLAAELAERIDRLENDALAFLENVDKQVATLRADLARLSAANDVAEVRLAA